MDIEGFFRYFEDEKPIDYRKFQNHRDGASAS
jgi:hypothetical protein